MELSVPNGGVAHFGGYGFRANQVVHRVKLRNTLGLWGGTRRGGVSMRRTIGKGWEVIDMLSRRQVVLGYCGT